MAHRFSDPLLERRTFLSLLGFAGIAVTSGCTVGKVTTSSSPAATTAAARTIVDGFGRTVTLNKPAERAVVVSRYTNELIRAIGSIDKVVGVDLNTAQDRVYWPQFDPAKVISAQQGGLNFEQVFAYNPDVLIEGDKAKIEADAAKVKQAGIETVAVVPWDQEHFARQIEILGQVFGNEEGAKKVLAFFTENLDAVKKCVAGRKPVKVYWEYGDPFTTCVPGTSNQGWYDMLSNAGGESIFPDPKTGKTVDPEKILAADPDVIIKTSSGPALKNTGVYTPPTAKDFADISAEMLARPGWKDLKAVKNGRVHITTGFCGGGLGKMVGAAYAATWFHPEATSEIKPDEIFAKWMKFQGVAPITGHNFTVPKQ